jgi:hypothetical protein
MPYMGLSEAYDLHMKIHDKPEEIRAFLLKNVI